MLSHLILDSETRSKASKVTGFFNPRFTRNLVSGG